MNLDFNWESEVAFSHTYSKGLLGFHLLLFTIALAKAIKNDNTNLDNFYAEFGRIWTSVWFICLQASVYCIIVYWTRNKCGLIPTLPNEKSKASGRQTTGAQKIDFTKGSLLRRVMQRIKYCKMKLSNVQYLAKKLLTVFIFLIVVTYVVFCFGAPLNFYPFLYFLNVSPSDFSETTLAFALLVTIHTGLPTVLVYGAETIGGGLMHVFLTGQKEAFDVDDQINQDNKVELNSEPIVESLYVTAMGAFIGAWFGAFPIPLDWDRPWQVWPVSCNIGLAIGALMGSSLSLYNASQLRRKKDSSSILTSIKSKKS